MKELFTLRQLFCDEEDRFFRVPDYQRGYSWGAYHRQDLLEDIQDLNVHDMQHFTGTVVAARPNEHAGPFLVVDGQQRLITLILLISRLTHRLRRLESLPSEDMTRDGVWNLFIQKNLGAGKKKWRLELNGSQNSLFKKLLEQCSIDDYQLEAQSKSDINLKHAALEFDTYLSKYTNENELQNLFYNITQRLGFLFYAPEDRREIGLMFEVINNRGKPLSELEKVKNYLIYYANRHDLEELRKTVNESWSRILSKLNRIGFTENEDEQRFLRVCWIVFHNPSKIQSHHVYDGLKKACPPNYDDTEKGAQWLKSFINFMEGAAIAFERLYEVRKDFKTPEDFYLERIFYHPAQASILPLIVAVFHKVHDSEARAKSLDLIEKLNFRFYIVGNASRSDSMQGLLFDLAHCFFHRKTMENQNEEWIKALFQNFSNEPWTNNLLQTFLIQFIEKNANTKKLVKQLTLDLDESGDYYNWQGLKFFLASYEQKLCAQRNHSKPYGEILRSRDPEYFNDFFQKEHILAKNENHVATSEDILKRRLGNFALVREGTNKGVGCKPIQEKIIEGYQSQGTNELYQLQELGYFYKEAESFVRDTLNRKYQNWVFLYYLYQKLFDLREERLINFALERWGIDELNEASAYVSIDSYKAENEIFLIQKP